MLLTGLFVAWAMYIKKSLSPERLLKIAPLRGLYELYSQLWYFDRLYQDGVVPACKWINYWFWQFDAKILDGILIDGWSLVIRSIGQVARGADNWFVDKCVDAFGWITYMLGVFARLIQFGKIQYYVCVSFGVVAAVLLWIMLGQ